MKVMQFIEKLHLHNEELAYEKLFDIVLDLGYKGYHPNEVYDMDVDYALFLMKIPYSKPIRRGNTTWGAHLTNS